MKRARGLAIMLGLVLAAIVIGESALFKQIDTRILEHQRLLLIITIGLGAAGFTILLGGGLSLAGAFGEPMSHGDVEEMMVQQRNLMAWPYSWRKFSYRVIGTAVGRQAEETVSFREMKEAWRQGEDKASFSEMKEAWKRRAWRSEPRWRRLFVMAAGGTMMFFGLFGLAVVVGPPAVKVLFGGAIVYAVARTVAGFARA